MWRRGADLDGNVANFVETEQILESKGYLASYILVCCSLFRSPLFIFNFLIKQNLIPITCFRNYIWHMFTFIAYYFIF